MARITLKRFFDILAAIVLLILLLPLLIFIGILIMLDSPGSCLLIQKRLGKKEKIFLVYKFRTMYLSAEKFSGPKWVADSKYITGLGSYLRFTNLDELPQLYNVLIGDMSLVGPRPERSFFVNIFKDKIDSYKNRMDVRPGITGLAQVKGYAGNTSIKKRVYCDLRYIQNQSLLLDFAILVETANLVILKVVGVLK